MTYHAYSPHSPGTPSIKKGESMHSCANWCVSSPSFPPKCGRSVENEDREAVDVCPKRCFCAWILAPVGNFCEAVELGTRCLAGLDELGGVSRDRTCQSET